MTAHIPNSDFDRPDVTLVLPILSFILRLRAARLSWSRGATLSIDRWVGVGAGGGWVDAIVCAFVSGVEDVVDKDEGIGRRFESVVCVW